MSATIMATLELQRGQFKTEQEKTTRELGQLKATFAEAGGALTILERQMKSDAGNKALQQQVTTAKKEFRALGQEITVLERQKANLDRAMGGGGVQLAGDKRVRKGALGLEGALLGASGDNPLQMATGVASSLMMTLRMNLASMLGIGIGIKLAEGIEKAIEKAKELDKTIKKAMEAGNGTGSKFGSDESKYGALGELHGAIGETADHEDSSIYESLYRAGRNMKRRFMGQQSVEDENDGKIEGMDQKRQGISNDLAAHKAAELDLDKRAREEGEASVAVDREELRLRQEIGKVQEATNHGLDGTAAEKIRQALIEESNLRKANLALAKADEERGLKVREDKVRSAHPDVIDKDGIESVIDSDAEGKGVNNARIDMLAAIEKYNALVNDKKDPTQAKVEMEEKTAAFVEAADASKEELGQSKAITQEMQLRADGHQNEANLTAIRAQYEEKIAGYLRDGKTELAQQSKLQEKMALDAAALANFRRDPTGKMAEAQAKADKHDTNAKDAREAREIAAKRQRYEDDHRAELPTDAAQRAAFLAHKFPDPNGVLHRATTGAAEAKGNVASPTFDDLVNGGRSYAYVAPQPDRRGVATADPQKSAAGKDGNAPVVSELGKIYTLLDTRLNLTIP